MLRKNCKRDANREIVRGLVSRRNPVGLWAETPHRALRRLTRASGARLAWRSPRREQDERADGRLARPPVATQRFSQLEEGRLFYRLKRRWRDGTTHVVFEPQELIEKFGGLGFRRPDSIS